MNSICCMLAGLALLATASAMPQRQLPPRGPPGPQAKGQEIPILSQTFELNPDGSYKWSYETGNQIKANEEGQVKAVGQEEAMQAQGAFSYTADDGTPIEVSYVANENGFQPKGAHLPTPPPIPPEILKSLEWNKAHPEEDDGGDGKPKARPAGRK